MEAKETQQALGFMLARIKAESFVAGYQASDEQALALLVSKFFQWDGLAILRTAALALEDANYHGEAALIERMAEQAAAK